jgi:hypothetical protein
MRVAVFLCSNETMTECYTLGLFGTNEPYGRAVRVGDLCLLYNYSDNKVYGVWAADSTGGTYKPTAWRGRYPHQVKVKQVSKAVISVGRAGIQSLVGDGSNLGRIYDGDAAQEILQHFASVYHSSVTTSGAVHENEGDYRARHPAQFFCDDGHRVRSPGEKIIDDWLRRHGVQHDYESITAIPGLIPDFVVFDRRGVPVFIEYWGMTSPEYQQRRLRKSQIYAQFMLPLVELYPHHLETIDATLMNALRKHDVYFR